MNPDMTTASNGELFDMDPMNVGREETEADRELSRDQEFLSICDMRHEEYMAYVSEHDQAC